MKKKITIYTSKTCPYCDQVKEKLKENSIKFTEVDIVEYKKVWEDVTKLTGIPSTPTVKINDDFLLPGRDYLNADNLILIINAFRECEYSETRRTLELVKTLNYNTYSAFQGLQQILMKIENKLNTGEDEHKSTN